MKIQNSLIWSQKKVMGRSAKRHKSSEDVLKMLSKILVPENILQDFEITDTREYKTNWEIELHEKEERLPKQLVTETDMVLDGYCNPVEILSYSFSLKPVYLKLYRRRWKKSNTDQHYSNDYDFTIKGVKIVPELGFFLKEEDRRLSR